MQALSPMLYSTIQRGWTFACEGLSAEFYRYKSQPSLSILTKSTQTPSAPCSAFYPSHKILAISLDMRAERKRKVRRGRFIRVRECRSRFYIIRWCLVRLLCWHD
ncbi:hypothetical protein PVAP13_2KG188991 [Panicum virgatum]|uniref:Uncharacterized protein n=1 Tax=Panicum virgatum TaxID=38727 RepID=A0A8T0WHN6_PANVG|nr:hypothetical protein PVAP13_2KG188991 [Panicum virgatum]